MRNPIRWLLIGSGALMIVGGLVAGSQTGALSTTVKEVGISTMVGGVIIGVVGLTRTAGPIAATLVTIVAASCFLVAADAAFDLMYEGPARQYLGPRITLFGALLGFAAGIALLGESFGAKKANVETSPEPPAEIPPPPG